MSLSNVMKFFRTQMTGLGYTEHKDGFNSENIPSNLLSKAFFIELDSVSGVKMNQNDQEVKQDVVLAIFLKGYNNPAAVKEYSQTVVENVIKRLLRPDNRVAGYFKNVIFEGSDLEPLDLTNDNAMIIKMKFKIHTIIEVEGVI